MTPPSSQHRTRLTGYSAGVLAVLLIIVGTIAWTRASPPGRPVSHGEPDTVAGVRAAAARELSYLGRGQFAAAWRQLTPSEQHAIPESTWTSYYTECPAKLTQYSLITATTALPDNGTAIAGISYTDHHVSSPLMAVQMTYYYVDGHWRYAPPLSIWTKPSVSAMLKSAQAAGTC